MSTTWESELIIGNHIDYIDVDKTGYREDVDEVSFTEYMEGEYGMFYTEEHDWVGFTIKGGELNLNMTDLMVVQDLAKKFKKITGAEAKLASVIWKY